jgi:predicted acetyltransferase
MAVEIRPLVGGELPELIAALAYAFAGRPGLPGADVPPPLLPEWSTCAFVDGRLATSFGAIPFRVRLDGTSVAMAGVTCVMTLPEFRRRGLLRQVITRALAEQRDRGQAMAILWASMAAIYQRFGFGLASTKATYDVDRRRLAFTRGDRAGGSVQLTTREEARPIVEDLFEEYSRPRNLMIQRDARMWDIRLADGERRTTHFGIYHNAAGEPRGYTVVQLSNDDVRGHGMVLDVVDLATLDADAYRGIWEFFAAHDLVDRVRWDNLAEDDPAALLMLEPRVLGRRTRDGIWMRITDVASALTQRPYDDGGVLSVNVRDELCSWNEGTWSIETAEGETAVRRGGEADTADLTMDVSSLAVLVAGHRSATTLARAGLVSADEKALATADRMFATAYAPWCPDLF